MSPAKALLALFLSTPLFATGTEPLVFKHVYDHSTAAQKQQGRAQESPFLGKPMPFDTPILIGQGSRIEVENPSFLMRVGASSELQHHTDGGIALDLGSILIQPAAPHFKLSVSTKKCHFTLAGQGAFILEATSNGGCKLISLSPGCEVMLESGATRKLVPGNLVFLLPQNQQFGPVLNIDLSVLLSTSALINRFPTPLSGTKALRSAAFFQMHRIKSRSNALIGDARDANNYDVVFVK
jgi:hypothetical protein